MTRYLFAVLFLASTAHASPGQVVGVTDGDTVTVLDRDRKQVKCRLYGIDAPERRQAFGERAKQALSDLVYRRQVDVLVVDRDRYGRSVCRLTLGGQDVNRQMVAAGMAWVYRKYTSDAGYLAAEAAARARRDGVWSDAEPVAPWEFRRPAREGK